MKLYDITYYSIDEGVLIPERTWVIQVDDDKEDEVLQMCSNLSDKISNGIITAQIVLPINFNDSFEEFIIEELKNL